MQINYPIKVQVIKSQGRPVRLYVAIPMALAVAINLDPGEEVQWELDSRKQLHLLRPNLKEKKK
jgi:antitoxin component of MazEF toxin-antitoxin module